MRNSDYGLEQNPSAEPDSASEIHITSFIVQAVPSNLNQLAEWIGNQSNAEVCFINDHGKMIVGMESVNLGDVTKFLDQMSAKEGVLDCALVYHQVEELDKIDDLIEVDPQQKFPFTLR